MKRRSFFGVMGGAAVAGPAMAKEAVGRLSTGMEGLSLGNGAGLVGEASGYATQANTFLIPSAVDEAVNAKAILGKLVGITAAQRAKVKRETYVSILDPDLASYRSLSLSAKIDMQKERMVASRISERKTFWQRIADGIGYNDPDDLPI